MPRGGFEGEAGKRAKSRLRGRRPAAARYGSRSSTPKRRRSPSACRKSNTVAGAFRMSEQRSGGLFVAPLIGESGVSTVGEALDLFPGARVDVIGVGPERARIAAHPRVRYLGAAGHGDVQ